MSEIVTIDLEHARNHLSEGELDAAAGVAAEKFAALREGRGRGSEFTGWYSLPSRTARDEVAAMNEIAAEVREKADVLVVLGIGGSYLGARCALEALNHTFFNQLPAKSRKAPRIFFGGQNLSGSYLADLLEMVEGGSLYVNVISKSGTTTETALAFRVFRSYLERIYGEKEASRRIIATTDEKSGGLRRLCETKGYRSFVIPGDVGGRFSVLTPVGLLPVACGGIDIDALLDGARTLVGELERGGSERHPCIRYAAARNVLYRKGKLVEILASFTPRLHSLGEWWKQLFGESEGKEGQGIFPACVDFSTDLHSLGQWIQDGQRICFETFLLLDDEGVSLTVPTDPLNSDGLGYLEGKELSYVNAMAARGTIGAHHSGGVPVMSLHAPRLDARTLGGLFMFFEVAVAVSGYMLGVNPFDQPGVEAYKKNMFRLLGKPSP